MPRPIDANQLAEMFAKAADLKAARSAEGQKAGRDLLAAIFARARELKLSPSQLGHDDDDDAGDARPEDTVVNLKARDFVRTNKQKPPPAAPAKPAAEGVARGWNEEAAEAPAPGRAKAVDPDDLLRTKFMEVRQSAIDEFRSSLEALFAESDEDGDVILATASAAAGEPSRDEGLQTLRPDAGGSSEDASGPLKAAAAAEAAPAAPAAPAGDAPGGDAKAGLNPRLFSAAAEAMFGGDMEQLEELVLEAWERRIRGKEIALASSSQDAAAAPAPAPAPTAAPPALAAPHVTGASFPGSSESPALASLEDGELLLNPPRELTSSHLEDLMSGFAFAGGNPVPAAELARQTKERAAREAVQAVQAAKEQVQAAREQALRDGPPSGSHRRPSPARGTPAAGPAAGEPFARPGAAPPVVPAPSELGAVAGFQGDPFRYPERGPPTLAWGVAPDDAAQAAPRPADPGAYDPFARPGAAPPAAPRSPALDLLARAAGVPPPQPRPEPPYAHPNAATVPDERAPILLPGQHAPVLPGPQQPGPIIDSFLRAGPANAAAPQPGPRAPLDAFAAPAGGQPAWPASAAAQRGWPGQPPPGATPPPGWKTGSAAQPALGGWPSAPVGGHTPPGMWKGAAGAPPGATPPGWKTGSGPQPALPPGAAPQPHWKSGSGRHAPLPPGGGWPQPAPHAPQGHYPAPQPAPPSPPVPPGWTPHTPPAQPHVPAGWPFVDARGGPAPPPAQAPGPARPGRPQQRPQQQHPPPPKGKPGTPPSGEGFDPFAPSWWDDKPNPDDVQM